jgi:hypothetical protein
MPSNQTKYGDKRTKSPPAWLLFIETHQLLIGLTRVGNLDVVCPARQNYYGYTAGRHPPSTKAQYVDENVLLAPLWFIDL